MSNIQSAERVSQNEASDNYVFQRSQLAYHKAAEIIDGTVLEIGTGSGYGISIIAPHCDKFITIDKTNPGEEIIAKENVLFIQMNVPPIAQIESESCDYVVSFQVIEHIKRDVDTMREIARILKPGGKLIISTPNKKASLTRNPWHVREYNLDEFKELTTSMFRSVEALGVFGNEKVISYYEKNRESVRSVMKYDILRLQYILPRWLLKIPYDIMNRRNRRKLLNQNNDLTKSIKMDDYYLAPADDKCFDFFFIAKK